MSEVSLQENVSLESLVARVADEFRQRQKNGERPDIEEYAARHPAAAELLRKVLASLELVGLSQASGGGAVDWSAGSAGQLGDFRILREVGKGGMGVVYEAEQVSLRRRVALKVLPFAATMDPRHLRRFQNEAQAAACLHHTNIVPVFSVGSERGVHFYAMQFIDGQPLSALIQQLRQAEKTAPAAGEERTAAYQPSPEEAVAATPAVRSAGDATPLTGEGKRGREYYRRVAELGVQAAEALDHAHQVGVVHRDVKPANLLLDGRGNLWVTDFGLALVRQGEAGLTMTGDLVGTLRYMSPEQALAKRVVIDHRTDIYSLGVTLFELLTLRPTFGGEDRQELLRQIAFEEPRPPRRLDRAIPAELEIIVLKALEKNPAQRYATAQELADDLRRYLSDQPIRARRPSWVQRARKWARRHRPAVWATSVLLLALLMLGLRNSWWWVQKQTAAETEAWVALQEADNRQREEKWSEALSAVRHAQGVLRGFGSDAGLRRRVDERAKDLEMAQRLEEARLQGVTVKDGHFDAEACIAAYREAFAWYGVDVEHADVNEAAAFLFARSIPAQLAAALYHWAGLQRSREDQACKHLLAVARAADLDRLRDVWELQGVKALDDLNAVLSNQRSTAPAPAGSPPAFRKAVSVNQLEARLQQGRQRRPADFWINHTLAFLLHHAQPPRPEEAVGYYRVAVALRPQSAAVHVNLGDALRDTGRPDEAIAEYKEAIRIKPDYAEAHFSLANAQGDRGDWSEAFLSSCKGFRLQKYHLAPPGVTEDGAVAEFREVLRAEFIVTSGGAGSETGFFGEFREIGGKYHHAGPRLADLWWKKDQLDKGQLEEAIAKCREVIPVKKDLVRKYYDLGNALRGKGRPDEALCVYFGAIHFNEEYARAHYLLSRFLEKKGRPEEAIAEYRNAVRVMKDAEAHVRAGNAPPGKWVQFPKRVVIGLWLWEAHNNLGGDLCKQGRYQEAEEAYRAALKLRPDVPVIHCNLGYVLNAQGRPKEAEAEYRTAIKLSGKTPGIPYDSNQAEAEYREAIKLNPNYAVAHNDLGVALSRQGRYKEAEAEYREALRLWKDYPEAHCNLGSVLEQKGQFTEALVHRRRGHELGSKNENWTYPSAQWVRDCERLVELDGKLTMILRGQKQPADTAERLDLAQLCQMPCKKRYAAALRFYREAFAAEPRLVGDQPSDHRYNAACAAGLAGCGQGDDSKTLDAKERARLRRQAVDWLRADLAAWRKLLEKEPDKARPAVAQQMQHWLQDPDFAGVRGADALAELPEAERRDWQKLWEEVEALRQRAAPRPAPASSARP